MFKVIFQAFACAIWVALLPVFVRPLRLSRRGSLVLALVLFAGLQKFIFYRLFGGDAFVPELPAWLIHVLGWIYGACVLLFPLACLGALWDAAAHVCARPTSLRLRRVRAVVFACAALALSLWGMWEGVRTPRVRTLAVRVAGLPRAFDGFRLVQLSDLHCSSAARADRTRAIVAAANACRPDLVCVTGDFVDGPFATRADDVRPLAALRAPCGVFGCTGNHEYYGDYPAWRPFFASLGIRMLVNEHVVLERGGARLVLAGVSDAAARRLGLEGPDLARAFRGAPPDAPRILLQHQPFLASCDPARERVALQLSGHTHGGAMWVMEDFVRRHNHGYVRGLYERDGRLLYVSPGTGQWAGFPLRLGVPAEITVLVLKAS